VIVSAAAVVRYASAGKGRLAVQLAPAGEGEVQVGPERAAAFEAWLAQ
jgi:hypothetical protein